VIVKRINSNAVMKLGGLQVESSRWLCDYALYINPLSTLSLTLTAMLTAKSPDEEFLFYTSADRNFRGADHSVPREFYFCLAFRLKHISCNL